MTNLWVFFTSLDVKSISTFPGPFWIENSPRSALRTLDFVAKGGCGIGNTHQYEWRCSSFIQTPNTVCAWRKMLVEIFFSVFFCFVFGWLKFFGKEWLFKSLLYKAWNDLQVGNLRTAKRVATIFHLQFSCNNSRYAQTDSMCTYHWRFVELAFGQVPFGMPGAHSVDSLSLWKLRRKQLPCLGWWWIFRWTEIGESFPLFFLVRV